MGADEGQFMEGNQVDTGSEKRKQIVDILVTWYQSTSNSSLEIFGHLEVYLKNVSTF